MDKCVFLMTGLVGGNLIFIFYILVSSLARVFARNQQSHNEQIENLPHAKFVIQKLIKGGLKLTKLSILGRRYRSVWHLSWYEFNEQHCPKNLSQFLKFLEELSSVRLASVSEVPPGHNCNPPLMIHCNEGDKTGLTLVADLLLYTMDHNQVRTWRYQSDAACH